MEEPVRLADEYRRQVAWRDWPRVLDAVPLVPGQLVLDLGCGVGDPAALLARRGARVVAVDADEELLREARSRRLEGVDFRRCDLSALPDPGVVADGIWCSLVPAYFPDLGAALASWTRPLRPGGWIALTEIDDLWAHEPLLARTRALLDAYAEEALAAKRYDFRMGRKLRGHLEQAGFTVTAELALADPELSFEGPARPDVIDAWRARFDRLERLRDLCGPELGAVREDFLACLARPDHRSRARVLCCVATR
jgi:SAM-dependent methyltransferase